MGPTSIEEVHRFDGWVIHPRERVLRVRGEPVKLGSRAFDVLVALVTNAGRLMSKAELLDVAWPGRVVEENNLSVQISALRKLLGAKVIVNVAGIGYTLTCAARPPERPNAAAAAAGDDASTELIGRNADLAALLPRLGEAAVLSVVGTGGVGKTALARALVARSTQVWRDGVHWIDLAPRQPGVPLLPVVASALGVRPDGGGLASGDVLRSLSGLSALIVLDNCEHLLGAVSDGVAPLLSAAPGLRWLATSREPLRVAGEEVYRLAPLDVAPAGANRQNALDCSALALLVQRARAADRGFRLDGDSVDLAVEVCRALDGLPLALEMAAARVATLGLRSVHEQLQRRLTLPSGRRDVPGRHYTLGDTFRWSYGLLSIDEQRLFRRLQPFHGGFTAAMVWPMAEPLPGEAPAADNGIDTLLALLDKSLVQRMPDGSAGALQRYTLLESARDFAAQQLDATGESADMLRHHAKVVASTFDSAWEEWLHSRDVDWSARYVPERGNVAAALAWACKRDEPALLARLVAAYASLDGFADKESALVQAGVPLQVLRRAPPPLRARACAELGWALFMQGSRELGTELLEQALDDSEATQNHVGIYLSLTRLIRLYMGRRGIQPAARTLWERLSGLDASSIPLKLRLSCESTVARHFDPNYTLEHLKQSHRIALRAGFDTQAVTCLTNITDELLRQGRFAEVLEAADEALGQAPIRLATLAFVDYNQAHALVRLGRLDEARGAARRTLRAAPSQAHVVIDLFALDAAQRARWEDAALMVGCSERVKRERDWHAEPAEAAMIDETRQALRFALPPTDLDRLLKLGAAMAVSDMLAMARLD